MWKPYQIYSTCGRAQSDLNEELFLFCGGGLNMQMHQNVESLNIWRLSVQTVESDKSFRVASSARSCRVNLDSLCFLSPNLTVFQKKVLQFTRLFQRRSSAKVFAVGAGWLGMYRVSIKPSPASQGEWDGRCWIFFFLTIFFWNKKNDITRNSVAASHTLV